MKFRTRAKFCPSGKIQTGYVVKHPDGEVVATFMNREFGGWHCAKNAAEKFCVDLKTAAAVARYREQEAAAARYREQELAGR